MGADLLGLTRDALSVVLWVSLPLVIVATAVGLGVAILQAVTQIQDQSIGQAVRLVAVLLSLMVGVGWLGGEVLRFGERAFQWMEALQ
jgi:type III secretion protein S